MNIHEYQGKAILKAYGANVSAGFPALTVAEAVEAAINSRFDLVRWRMYEQTIEGADVETCVATIDGVPFNSLNSAGQVLAGLDIIRTFCRYYGATAPVFIDNAESISQTDFALDSQVIRLQVVEGAALELKTA